MRRLAGRAEGIEPPGAAGQQEPVLEELPFGQFQQAERDGNDRGVETAREEMGHQLLTGRFHDVELDARRRFLEALQQTGQEIGREGGQDTHGKAQRAVLEAFSHGLEEQRLVEDPERLLVRFAPEPGEPDTAAFPFDERSAERGFELTDLERERGLRDMYALGRTAERAMFDQSLEIAQLA